jgi:hypothetical protein
MTTLSNALRDLHGRYPTLVEFVRWLPFGIVAEDVAHSDACIQTYPAYCYVACNPALGAEKVVPGLIRLAVATVERRGMELGDGTTTFHEELAWFYSYSRAVGLTGLSPDALLPPGVRTRWEAVADGILKKERLDLFDAVRATLIAHYGTLGAGLLAKVVPRELDVAWEAAAQSQTFSEFMRHWTKAGLPETVPQESSSFLLQNQKSRAVVHHCYGRRSGVLATTVTPWVGSEERIRDLLYSTLHRPLIFENHDLDRPVALIANQHLHRRQDDVTELHVDILVFDEQHWHRRDTFGGFSVAERAC